MRVPLALAALFAAEPCFAQESARPGAPSGRPAAANDGWSITLGLAPVVGPAWQGSRDMVVSVYPDLRIAYKDALFASIPDGLGWNALNRDGWKAGPIAKLRFSRSEARGGSPFRIAGGSDALRGLGSVGAAAELGGFVDKRIGNWQGRVEVRRGFGGHEGVIGDLALSYRGRAGRTAFSIGPRASVASTDYIDTYFGIDAGQAQRSGLRTYAAPGGLLSYGLGGSAVRPLDRRSALTLFGSVERLGGAAGDSPLVRERGRRTQFTLGLGYGLRFQL